MDFNSFLYGLLTCFLLSFLLGIERQYRRRFLGLRTMILVSVGSYLFVSFSFLLVGYQADASRIAAQVVAGIGFLGAGTIITTGHNRVKGLTTAAGLWASACVGLAIGIGFYEGAILGTVMIFFAMVMMHTFDEKITASARVVTMYIELDKISSLKNITSISDFASISDT